MNKPLRQKLSLVGLTVLLGTLGAASMARADTPGKHPGYLHARSDLRQAELLLRAPDEPNVQRVLRQTAGEVHEAIREIDRAAVLDHKDIDDNPRIDTTLKRTDRLHAIEQLLAQAKRDLTPAEDNRAAQAWRRRAQQDIQKALSLMTRASALDKAADHRAGY